MQPQERLALSSIESRPLLKMVVLQNHPSKENDRRAMEAFEAILSKPSVACWSGEKILDWYLGTQKAKA